MNGILNTVRNISNQAQVEVAKTVYGPEIMIGFGIAIIVMIVFLIIAISTFATGHWAVGLIFTIISVALGGGIWYAYRQFY